MPTIARRALGVQNILILSARVVKSAQATALSPSEPKPFVCIHLKFASNVVIVYQFNEHASTKTVICG